MKKIISIIFLSVLLISNLAWGEEANRWYAVRAAGSPSSFYVALDTNTVSYNPVSKSAVFWVKEWTGTSTPGTTYKLDKIEVSYTTKEVTILRQLYYKEGRQQPEHNYVFTEPLSPGSVYTLSANYIASKNGIDPVYKQTENQWVWVKSTDVVSYYICSNNIRHDSEKGLWFFETKDVDTHGRIGEGPSLIAFNFTDRTYGTPWGMPTIMMKEVIPDSIMEAYYLAAEKLSKSATDVVEIRAEDILKHK